ncbi:MAG: hypothetical protein H0V25_12040 [Solirubrobacterales bacterium]|nr:hypothetical protein [Solirubrobacterales bacterium]
MSDSVAGLGGDGLALRWRVIIATGLLGMLLGFLWGIADVPRYRAAASVVVAPSGAEAAVDTAELDRLAALGDGSDVAAQAGGLLGDDLAGADLLADVSYSPAAAGILRVDATADSPDFAVAAANAFAQALVQVAGRPVGLGAAATLPDSPSENRSAPLWSLIGLLIGLLAGALLMALAARRSSRAEPGPEPAGQRSLIPVEDAFGAPALARFRDPESLVVRAGDAVVLNRSGVGAFDRLVRDLGLEDEDPPRTLAVLDASPDSGSEAVALGLAIAAANHGLKVILVEANLPEPSLARRLGVAGSPGLADYIQGDATPRDVLRSVPTSSEWPEQNVFACVPAGEPRRGQASGMASPRFTDLVDRLPRVYDLVLFEAPPMLRDDAAAAFARTVDAVVLVSSDGIEASDAIVRSAERLAPDSPAAGVLTRPRGTQAASRALR